LIGTFFAEKDEVSHHKKSISRKCKTASPFYAKNAHNVRAVHLTLDEASRRQTPNHPTRGSGTTYEAMRHVAKGRHTLRIERAGTIAIDHLIVKAIPELMHCGLGFNSQIKSYGLYDMDFLKRDLQPGRLYSFEMTVYYLESMICMVTGPIKPDFNKGNSASPKFFVVNV
jgi:hypothetical protein